MTPAEVGVVLLLIWLVGRGLDTVGGLGGIIIKWGAPLIGLVILIKLLSIWAGA